MKRRRDEPEPLILKLRKRYDRYSTSAWGCRQKSYPVFVTWHRYNQNAIGHKFRDNEHAGSFFNRSYHYIHKMITTGSLIDNEYLLTYEKFK